MRIVALVSGGKDSIYTLCKMKDDGHEILACIYLCNKETFVDSYMYQTVGYETIKFIEEALQIPFIVRETECNAKNQNLEYEEEPHDEVEDLYCAVREAVERYKCEGVCSGAIESTYQKNRVENVCKRLNLVSFTPLWKRNQKELLKEMVDYGIEAVLVKIASPLIPKTFLCKDISDVYAFLTSIKTRWEVNYCGEGGEYETITLNCPYYKKKIVSEKQEILIHPEDINKNEDEQVVYCKFNQMILK